METRQAESMMRTMDIAEIDLSDEARVWRVWYHIQLLMYYGMNDGIPIQDKVLNGDEIYKSRNTIDECLNFISVNDFATV